MPPRTQRYDNKEVAAGRAVPPPPPLFKTPADLKPYSGQTQLLTPGAKPVELEPSTAREITAPVRFLSDPTADHRQPDKRHGPSGAMVTVT